MGHGEGQWQASVLIDTTAEVRMAHASHMRQAQGFTGVVHGCTQILPAKKELITGWLSLLPRGQGGTRGTPDLGRGGATSHHSDIGPTMAMLEAGTLLTHNLFQHTGTSKGCVSRTNYIGTIPATVAH